MIGAGVGFEKSSLSSFPLPSCPLAFLPQHIPVRSSNMTHAKSQPIDSAIAD